MTGRDKNSDEKVWKRRVESLLIKIEANTRPVAGLLTKIECNTRPKGSFSFAVGRPEAK